MLLIRGSLGAILSAVRPDDPEEETENAPDESSLLYECPACSEVYLSEERHECSRCGQRTESIEE